MYQGVWGGGSVTDKEQYGYLCIHCASSNKTDIDRNINKIMTLGLTPGCVNLELRPIT